MSTVQSLDSGMEPDEVTLEVVHHELHVLLGHGRVDLEVEGWGRGGRVGEGRTTIGVGERQIREVPPDVVRVGISHNHILESAGADLVVISGVTPAADTIRRFIEETRVQHVGRV